MIVNLATLDFESLTDNTITRANSGSLPRNLFRLENGTAEKLWRLIVTIFLINFQTEAIKNVRLVGAILHNSEILRKERFWSMTMHSDQKFLGAYTGTILVL